MSLISNARWITISQTFKLIAQLVSITLLTRLLDPKAYGVMAMVLVVTNLAHLFREMGTTIPVIQRSSLEQSLVSTVFWINQGLGLFVGIMIAITASHVSEYFKEPELFNILLIMAIIFPVSAIGLVPQALLERDSKFRKVAFIEVVTTFAALIAALAAAMIGAGVYSLVIQSVMSLLLSAFLMLHASSWRPSLQWSNTDFNHVRTTSLHIGLFQFINYFARNSDAIIIGRSLGSSVLGVYSLAYRIMYLPVQNLTVVANRALFPVLSRQQNSKTEMANTYLGSVRFVAFIAAPLMGGVWVLREPFINVVLGEKWLEVATLLQFLAPVGLIQSIVSTTGTVFLANGRTDILYKLGLVGSALMVSSFLVGAHWGIYGVAVSYMLANVLNIIPSIHYSCRVIGLSQMRLLAAISRPMFASMMMMLFIWMIGASISSYGFREITSLVICISSGIVFYIGVSMAVQRDDLNSLLSAVRSR